MKNTKKKIACLALASALVIPGVMGLSGCEKGHIHAFTSEPHYEVVTEDDVKIARSWKECKCGAEDAHKKVENAVIASANEEDDNYAQKILDSNINGKTIVFEDGEYGDLFLRPSAATATIYGWQNQYGHNNTLVELTNVNNNDKYHYYRDVNNVNFYASENAVFTSRFLAQTDLINNEKPLSQQFDAVRGISYDSSIQNEFVNHISLNKVTISNFNFNGGWLDISVDGSYSDVLFENVTIINNKLTSENANQNKAINVTCPYSETVKNVIIKNNYIDNYYIGIYISQVYNAQIENNTIKNSEFNAIAVQSNDAANNNFTYYNTGEIKIIGNTIINTGNRAIRFGVVLGTVDNLANIIIKDNTFTNALDDENELLKTQMLKYTSYRFENNIVDGDIYTTIEASNTGDTTTPLKIVIE